MVVVPATATAEDILRQDPDGVFLSNGPGDPAATGEYAIPQVQKVIETGKPVFGICLGYQILALALGALAAQLRLEALEQRNVEAMEELAFALEDFFLDLTRYPTRDEGLAALVSGDPESVHRAGISVRDNVIPVSLVHEDEHADHEIDWIEI